MSMNRITSRIPTAPARRLWLKELLAESRADRLGRQLDHRERQRAELEDRHELGRLGQRIAADARVLADLDVAAGDRVLDHWRRDDLAVEDDREVVADVAGRVVGEELRALVLQGEGDDALAELVGADRGACQLLTGEQRRELRLVDRVALLLGDLAERDEVETAGLSDESPDRLGIGDARQLDDDRSLPWVVTSGSETPVAFTRFSMIWRITSRSSGRGILSPTCCAWYSTRRAAAQVEAELRLDRPAPGVARIREGEAGNEVDDEGEDADDENQDRSGFAHQRRMIQEPPFATG
jgi:hypothetical protein